MLNELIQAAMAIPNPPETLHKSLKTLRNTQAYKVLLGQGGAMTEVVPWHEDISVLRKWHPSGNGHSTPIFNICPLYCPILEESVLKALRKPDVDHWPTIFGEIRARCTADVRTWIDAKGGEITERYQKSLTEIPQQLLSLIPEADKDLVVLRCLLERVLATSPDRFFADLAHWLEDRLSVAYDKDLFDLYCAPRKSKAQTLKNYNLLLDIPDWHELGEYPVTSSKTAHFLHALLTKSSSHVTDNSSEEPDCLDAYGYTASGSKEKFDELSVPGIGLVKLRTMFDKVECQYRYGKIDFDSFVVGGHSRKLARTALEYLTHKDREGQTWKDWGDNLILFYPEFDMPLLDDLAMADLCVLPDDDNPSSASASFDARAERIADALKGKPRESEVPVHLIVLRKPDGYRTKLIAHHCFTMNHFVMAARSWEMGAKDCPPIAFPRWGKEKGKRDDIVPITPPPGQVLHWLNTFWVRYGERQDPINLFTLEDALTLLLVRNGVEMPLVTRALRQALTNWSGFLIANGANAYRGVVLKTGDKRAPALRNLPSILALLLSKLNHTKEHIMQSPAFLIGRLMALSDQLHYQYCMVVRNKSLPPQLLGNALMQSAMNAPKSALAHYAQRILPYQAWAQTCTIPEGEKSPQGLARHLLKQMGEVCAAIDAQAIPTRMSDADRAQMILGYIAKVQSKDSTSQQTQQEQQ